MPHKIIVAYKTRLVPALVPSADSLTPPRTHKSEEAIAKWRAEQAEQMQAACRLQPYTATFDEVQLVDLKNARKGRWTYREPGGDKQVVALAVRQWLLKEFPKAWPNTTHRGPGVPEAIFIGFNPRLFLKVLGIDCSLPANQPKVAQASQMTQLPLSMWYTNTDHRDVEEAVMPTDFKYLTWDVVLRARGLRDAFAAWTGPGEDVSSDLKLATELAGQLGMLKENDG